MNRPALAVILIVSSTFLTLHLAAPLTDGMAVKQIYVAHKARAIELVINPARIPPLDRPFKF